MREAHVDENALAEACAGCALQTRRDFLRDAASAAAALLCALGAAPRDLAGLTFTTGTGNRVSARELSYPLPITDSATIDRDNEVILVRWQSTVYAFALSCPHQRTMLKWLHKEQRFQCPKHKSKYEPDGSFISGRATRGMDRYPVTLRQTTVVVDTTQLIKEDENRTAWTTAQVSVGG